jgi:isopenicillin N synthase-like dioxygenase
MDTAAPATAIPCIDIGALASPDTAARQRVAEAVGAACRGTGFFLITGHGVAP